MGIDLPLAKLSIMTTPERIQFLIEALELKKHPEGGYYKELYRSDGKIASDALGERFSGSRSFCTSIYFLLTAASFSSFHKIKQDEIWHFYEGSAIELHTISPTGEHQTVKIGSKLEKQETFQYTVTGGHWFAAKIMEEEGYALVGCTVAPGFDFEDFTLGDRGELIKMFPLHATIITELTLP